MPSHEQNMHTEAASPQARPMAQEYSPIATPRKIIKNRSEYPNYVPLLDIKRAQAAYSFLSGQAAEMEDGHPDRVALQNKLNKLGGLSIFKYPPKDLQSNPDLNPDNAMASIQTGIGSFQKIVEDYIHFVEGIVGRMNVRLSREEKIQIGIGGFMEAVARIDPARESFVAFTTARIRGSILDEMRALRKYRGVDRHTDNIITRVRHAEDELYKSVGKFPTLEELSAMTGLPKSEILANQEVIDRSQVHYISALEQNGSWHDPAGHNNPDEPTMRRAESQELKDAIANLPERDRTLIDLRYKQNLSFKEIGKLLEVSESRAVQLHKRAAARLKVALTATT